MRSPHGLPSCSWLQAHNVSAGAKLLTGLHVPCQKTAKQVLSQLAHLMRDADSTTVAQAARFWSSRPNSTTGGGSQPPRDGCVPPKLHASLLLGPISLVIIQNTLWKIHVRQRWSPLDVASFFLTPELSSNRNQTTCRGLVCLRCPVVVNHVRWNGQLRYLGGPPDNQVG